MAKYTVQDSSTNKTITFEWDGTTPPTDSDMEEVFAAARTTEKPRVRGITGDLDKPSPSAIISDVVKNIPKDSKEVAQGVVQMVAHPVKTLGAMGEALGGFAYDFTHQKPEDIEAAKMSIKAMAQDPTMQTTMSNNPLMDKAVEAFRTKPVASALALLAGPKPKGVPTPSEALLNTSLKKAVVTGMEKGISPSVAGKKTFTRQQNYINNAQSAVETIVKNKPNLRLTTAEGEAVQGLPKNLKQFSEAIEQTKKGIYGQYHAMAQDAGSAGAFFNTKPIIGKLDDVSKDVSHPPAVREYAEKLKTEIDELDGQPPEVIEARIADLNNSLTGYYEGRTAKAKAQVDASVANLMREELDNKITQVLGEGYQDLKNQYGALKAIEKDVNHRAVVDARKRSKGFFDLSDIFTGSTLVHGILSGNPAMAISGVAGKGLSKYYKWINDPNRYVGNMFSTAESILKKQDKIKPRPVSNKPSPTKPPQANPANELPVAADPYAEAQIQGMGRLQPNQGIISQLANQPVSSPRINTSASMPRAAGTQYFPETAPLSDAPFIAKEIPLASDPYYFSEPLPKKKLW